MTLNHVHLFVRDLDLTVRWIEEVWRTEPSVSNE
jgi:hypothetical protein